MEEGGERREEGGVEFSHNHTERITACITFSASHLFGPFLVLPSASLHIFITVILVVLLFLLLAALTLSSSSSNGSR